MGESVYKIIAVKFFSLTGETPDEDMIPAPVNPEYSSDTEGPGLMPHPCRELEKVLCNGGFYFSPQFDLTRSIQSRQVVLSIYMFCSLNCWLSFLVLYPVCTSSNMDVRTRKSDY